MVTQDLADFAAELKDATEALDRCTVMDASALAVMCELPQRFPALRSAFAEGGYDALDETATTRILVTG